MALVVGSSKAAIEKTVDELSKAMAVLGANIDYVADRRELEARRLARIGTSSAAGAYRQGHQLSVPVSAPVPSPAASGAGPLGQSSPLRRAGRRSKPSGAPALRHANSRNAFDSCCSVAAFATWGDSDDASDDRNRHNS